MALSRPSPEAVAGNVLAALPDFALSAVFLATWISPNAIRPDMVGHLLLVMLLEFIVVHSAGFMGVVIASDRPRTRRVLAVVGLGLFYTLFAWAFGLAMHSRWPVPAFWGLVFNRLLPVLLGPEHPTTGAENRAVIAWAVPTACYLLFVFVTVIPPIPALGITPRVIEAQHFDTGGIWTEQPYRVLAFGCFYFAALGVAQLLSFRATRPVPARAPAAS